MEFQAILKKGNNKGVGFISIPLGSRDAFSLNDCVELILNSKISFFSKVKFYGTLGFYVPCRIMKDGSLLGKKINIKIKKVDGFYTTISSDGRLYIPDYIASRYLFEAGDIVEIKSIIDGNNITKFCKINSSKRKRREEYTCVFDSKKSRKKGIFKIIRKLNRTSNENNAMFGDFNFAKVDDEYGIIFLGNRMPIIIKLDIMLKDFANYLGCYFADGTKRGNDWGICASTFEQANYYLKMHTSLVFNSKIIPSISFTEIEYRDEKSIKNYLINAWEKNTPFHIEQKRVRLNFSDKGSSPAINPFGSLILKEHKQLVQIYYNKLLNRLLKEIKVNNDKSLAMDFIFGVLEGDGSVSSKSHGHIIITSNAKELKILEEIVKITGFNYKVYMEGLNKGYIRFWSLELIKNISILKDKIFKYYPKRRRILKERLGNTGCARYLLGKNKKTSNWLIGQLNKFDILDGKGNLTDFGKKVKKDLNEFLLSE
ncbi:MAG: hypothetical protein ABIH25_04105 [Candidatus Woesearchaeota archaeon]